VHLVVRIGRQRSRRKRGSAVRSKDHTSGDVGYLDQAGRLLVTGRIDEMIVSGGENVYPIEVEKVLVSHPDVAEAAVIGVDDEQYGQRLAAFVVLLAGATATGDGLKRHVRTSVGN
jgi:acyl-coenzyme A synthetase/AMP-(fatty) acid ligase